MGVDIEEYFSGKRLYGDDFTPEEIAEWFSDEAEGYADLGAKNFDDYSYVYHELNKRNGFRFLGEEKFKKVLGLGSAYGHEFLPIVDQIKDLTILDPSDEFKEKNILGLESIKYVKPLSSGDMPFDDGEFDLIVCLGVMHHIPNVSHVLSECHRILKEGGKMVVREPITSMGDWRKPRAGLTKRERGIPAALFEKFILTVGFEVVSKRFCNYPLIPKLANKVKWAAYNSYILTLLDAILCRLSPKEKIKYHRTSVFEKLFPASIYYVLRKRD